MEIANIALQEISVPSYTPSAESFNNKLMHEPSNKTDFNAVMETLEHIAMVTEQPMQAEAADDSLLFCSEPKTIVEPSAKEGLDNPEVLLCEEPKVNEEEEKSSELLTGTVEDLEAEPNKKQTKEDILLIKSPFAINKCTQNSADFEPKEDQTANERVHNSPNCSSMRGEQGIVAVKVLEDKQSLPTMSIIDAERECGSDGCYEQLENLMPPNSHIAAFAKGSNLELHVEPEPVTFKQDIILQSEKLVHNVWQKADLVQQLKENDVHSLRAEQPWALGSEANELDTNLFEHKDLDLEPELATVTKQADITTYEQEAAEQDENSLDLTSSSEDFKPYVIVQNIQELNQAKGGYYDAKTVKVITKQIAFNIEKAIANIENSQPIKIQISLTPKELGTLVINFVVEEGKIAMLTIAAANQHTKELISRNMGMLQQELNESGFEVKTVEVFGTGTSNSGSSTESGQHGNQERQQEAYERLLQRKFERKFTVNFGKKGEIA